MDKYRILIIEDDEDHAFLEGDILRDELSCDIEIVSSKKQMDGVNLLELDVILLDFNLPDASGDELTKIIRKQTDIPIIVITGDGELTTAIETLKNGANDFLIKSAENITLLPTKVQRVYEEYVNRKLLDEQRKEKDEMLTKIETLRQVLATLAHYINNATTTIYGYAQLSEQDPMNIKRSKKLSKISIKETQKITFVLQELENFINSMEIRTTNYVNIPNAMFEIEENIKKKMEEL